MRWVNCTGCVIDHKWFFRRHGLLELDPFNDFIGHVGGEVIVRVILLGHLGHTILKAILYS